MKKIYPEKTLVLYTDGACRGNPGEGGAGIVLTDLEDNIVLEEKLYLGDCTNNQAEYRALILGLEEAKILKPSKLIIKADSELLVRQIQGIYKVKNEGLQPLYLKVMKLLKGFRSLKIEHIPRERNKKADKLANLAIDKKEAVGESR